jgi:hypothetical protein
VPGEAAVLIYAQAVSARAWRVKRIAGSSATGETARGERGSLDRPPRRKTRADARKTAPRAAVEADERRFETAAEFWAALEKYAERATQIKRVNH